MNIEPIVSYLRHLVVVAVLFLVEKFKLPVEGSEDLAHAIALLLVGSLTWLLVKYAPRVATTVRNTPNLILISLIGVGMCSCAGVTSGVMNTPIPATAVQRAGQDTAPIILIASGDLALAEQSPIGTVHGLYNASALASQITAIRGKSSK